MHWRSCVSALAICVLLGHPSIGSTAKHIPTTTDRIIYAQGEALWSIPSEGGSPTQVVLLPFAASKVSRIKVAASGTALLVSIGEHHAWASLRESQPTTLHFIPCGKGSANISTDGDRVVCTTQVGARIAVYQMRSKLAVRIVDQPTSGPLFFAGNEQDAVGFGKSKTLVTDKGRTLSPHQPDHFMEVTADGKRAVGAYDEGEIDVVYAFRIDGRAVKRTLMQAARVVSISANSEWACLQQEIDACAVRIAGGQYMCWRSYEAIDISSKAGNVLVSRAGKSSGHDLFLGSISGTKAGTPKPLVEAVGRAAAFWPLTVDTE